MKNIVISDELWRELNALKYEKDLKSLDNTIKYLLKGVK